MKKINIFYALIMIITITASITVLNYCISEPKRDAKKASQIINSIVSNENVQNDWNIIRGFSSISYSNFDKKIEVSTYDLLKGMEPSVFIKINNDILTKVNKSDEKKIIKFSRDYLYRTK